MAPSVKEVATRGTGTETGDGWTQAGVTEERGADRREAGKRQRQALSLVSHLRLYLFKYCSKASRKYWGSTFVLRLPMRLAGTKNHTDITVFICL